MAETEDAEISSKRKTEVILGVNRQRETWDRHIEFLLASFGDCIGLGNLWRFPYVLYENGGGAFLIPYLILLVAVGVPIFVLESSIGQFSRYGAIAGFSMVPICKGVGYISMVNSLYFSSYYILLLCYTTKYFFLCFTKHLPWAECSKDWGADIHCVDVSQTRVALPRCTEHQNETTDPCRLWETKSEQFWDKKILHEEDNTSLSNIGTMQLDLVLLLILNWLVLYACMIKGVKSTGKVVCFTVIYPVVVLVVLAIYGCTLDGALEGLRFLFEPEWKKIFEPKVWTAALGQMFFSMSLGLGSVTLFGSYNKLHSRVHRDAFIIVFVDFGTSILASVAIFNIMGYLAKQLKTDVGSVVSSGEALLFHVVPDALLLLDGSQLWLLLFFLTIYTLGIDSLFISVLTLHTAMKDEIPRGRNFSVLLLSILCVVLFLLGLPYTTQGGIELLTMMDVFLSDISLIFAGLAEVATVAYLYGIYKYRDDLQFLVQKKIGWGWLTCWVVVAPMIIVVVFILAILEFPGFEAEDLNDPDYHPEDHPSWEISVGTFLTLTSLLQVPVWGIYVLIKYKLEKRNLKDAMKPNPDWGPSNAADMEEYKEWKQELYRIRQIAAAERQRIALEKAEAKERDAAEKAAEQERREARKEEMRATIAAERERRAAKKAARKARRETAREAAASSPSAE